MKIQVGQLAPDFELPDQDKQAVRLSQYRGQKVFLVFYAADFSSICTSELDLLLRDLPDFEEEGVRLLAVSTDNTYSHAVFKQQKGYRFPLLSDFWPHGAVAWLYGVFDAEKGMARRGTFAIDEQGIVRDALIHDVGEARSEAEFKACLAKAA